MRRKLLTRRRRKVAVWGIVRADRRPLAIWRGTLGAWAPFPAMRAKRRRRRARP